MYLPSSSSSSLPISALPKRRFSHPFPKYQVRRNRSIVFLVPGSRRRYFQRKGTEYRNIVPATSEREENLDGAYVSYGGNRKPGFGARTGEERESARTNAPTFPATLYPLLSLSPLLPSFSCFSRCRASAPKTRLYRAGCDWSVDPVIHRKRRMQTVT